MVVFSAAILLTALMLIGFERDLVYWLYRFLGFVAMFGFIYDRRVRTPRQRAHDRQHVARPRKD